MDKPRRSAWGWLFIIPFLALLFPRIYAHSHPMVLGFPMFYWYLILWIVLTAVISAIVYVLTGPHHD